jgi:beta-phosphoglucomutase
MTFQGAIFDLDGLLVDSEPVQAIAFNAVLERYGIELTDTDFTEMVGIETIENFRMLRDRHSLPESAEQLLKRKDTVYQRLVPVSLVERPGAIALVTALHEQGVPLAVASSSPQADVVLCLECVDIIHLFSHVVTADDVEQRKPAPDLYLLAAGKLGLAPERCIAFEDTLTGLQAAQAAGVPCIVAPNKYTAHHDFVGALARVKSLADLTPAAIRQMLT